MANLVMNIQPLITEISRFDIRDGVKSLKNQSVFLREWEALMRELKNASVKIGRGEDLGTELLEIRRLANSIAIQAAELGSMIPGPVGVACSVALAICCLMPPLDLLGFLLNLLGAIPFAKGAAVGLKPILKEMVTEALKNPWVRGTIRAGHDASRRVIRYNKTYVVKAYNKILSNSNPFHSLRFSNTINFDVTNYTINERFLGLTERTIK